MDEVLLRYINKTSPIKASLDGRIKTTDATSNSSGNNGTSADSGNGVAETWAVNRGLFALLVGLLIISLL
jgi:hypothetical protein